MTHDLPERPATAARPANSPRFLLFLICLFASAGQLAIDIYVPALPAMARYFATSPQAIQSSVSGYLAAYALGQLVFGPISDALGRKRVLAFGLVVYTIGCLLSLAAPNLETFVLARCLQGFGIAATNLLAKAIITDSFVGTALMHAFTYMSITWGLAPIIAPVIGAHLQELFGWKACLVFLLVYSLAMWALLWRFRETLRQPVRLEPRTLIANAGKVLASPVFQSCFLAQGLCYSILLVFNVVGPFMVQNTLHRPPTFFGYLALGIGLMYFLGGLSNRLHGPRLPTPEQRLRVGARVMAAAAIAMLVLALTVGLRVWTLAVPVLVMGLSAGAMYPTLMAKGNSLFPHIAGLTSAILGCALLLVSSAMMGLAGFVSVHVLTPLAVFFVLLALTVVVMVTKLLRHLAQSDAAAAALAQRSGEAA
ncbi:multidrug effflux MFS transporter [Paraburkholderia silvatlantica]|uniref:DHA1 family 2-module integral membrane pump EmrD-like MFS transporter n=1 Tax=Paraburkholderia silvatlantica TaxID=321895 RepID=A0ABR6FHA0_9BURK|nr:multidrug effflux MFS transporter [Paraburkholderia silvatlantica]MBB2926793.1 DHA1 family 2-module integral membrane pump EmrD-like MFS transporter [Paraburkholderia silvatlantica]PVY37580.1 DHA1 family 2-module integral membrane pump EmrD-like MFS transporter [Paraburkholderia silvatlantica]PXW42542.1 DHA1 family 2-module integral membrane pump EmrD-like MFS transporter [Paraburkholderia silvatlantica]